MHQALHGVHAETRAYALASEPPGEQTCLGNGECRATSSRDTFGLIACLFDSHSFKGPEPGAVAAGSECRPSHYPNGKQAVLAVPDPVPDPHQPGAVPYFVFQLSEGFLYYRDLPCWASS